MASTNVDRILLQIEADSTSANKALSTIEQVQNKLVDLQKAGTIDGQQFRSAVTNTEALDAKLKLLNKDLEETNGKLDNIAEGTREWFKESSKAADLRKQINRYNQELEDTPDILEKSIQKMEELERRTKDAESSAAKYGQQWKTVSDQTAFLGDIDSNLQATGSALNTIAPGVGAPLQIAGDAAAAAEALPKLKTSLAELGNQAASAGGIIGSAASAAGGGLAGLAAAAAPVLIIVGALAAALKLLEVSISNSRKQVELANKTYQVLDVGIVDKYGEALNLTTAELEKQITQQEKNRGILSESQKEISDNLNMYSEGLRDASHSAVGNIPLLSQVAEGFTFAASKLHGQSDFYLGKLEEVDVGLQNTTANLTILQSAEVKQAALLNDIANAEQDLAQVRDQVASSIDQLTQQFNDTASNFDEQTKILDENRGLRNSREREDFLISQERVQAQHDKKLESMQTSYYARIEQLRSASTQRESQLIENLGKSLANVAKKTTTAISQIDSNLNKSIAKLEKDANSKRTDEARALQKDLAKIEQDTRKERLEAAKDFGNAQFDAQINNDILKLIQAQRADEQRRKQIETDHKQEIGSTKAEAQERKMIAEEEARIRIQELRDQAAERRAEIIRQATEQRQQIELAAREQVTALQEATQQQIETARVGYQAQVTEAKRGFEEQESLAEANRKLRLRRQKEDDDIADQRRQNALQKQLDAIDDRADKEIEALDNAVQRKVDLENRAQKTIQGFIVSGTDAATRQIKNSFQQLLFDVQNSTRSGSSSLGYSGSSSYSAALNKIQAGGAARPFFEGGVVPKQKEVYGRFEPNRNFDELVLPLTQKNIEKAANAFAGGKQQQSGGMIINVGDINVGGDGVTREEVRDTFMLVVQKINAAVGDSITGKELA